MVVILKHIYKAQTINIFDLYKKHCESIPIPDFWDSICCLYAIDIIEYDFETKQISYVENN